MDISASQAVTLHSVQHMRARVIVKNSDISCNFHIVPPSSALSSSFPKQHKIIKSEAASTSSISSGAGNKGPGGLPFSKRRYSLSSIHTFFVQVEELYVAMQYREGGQSVSWRHLK